MRVTALNVHPLKSAAPCTLSSAQVLARGFADDRSWMVVDGDGVLVSAREERRLLLIRADTPVTDPAVRGALRLRCDGHEDLDLDGPDGPGVAVRLHRNELRAVAVSADADEWLNRVVGREDLRLVRCADPTARALNPRYSRPGEHTAFADGYPVTVATEASLRQLNAWIGQEPLEMRRFRPNLVLGGSEPFEEDRWHHLQVGTVRFRVAKPVDRCVITTIDPHTLASGKEPIRTLARHRLTERKTLFAVHLIPETTGRIAVGDAASAS